jgi:hypothetical protein
MRIFNYIKNVKSYLDFSDVLVNNIYPSCFGVCMFLLVNDSRKLIKDNVFDKSCDLWMVIYVTTIIYQNYNYDLKLTR